MAGDSRMSGMFTEEREEKGEKFRLQQQLVLSDSAYKVVELQKVPIGISVYDAGVIDNQPVDSHVRRFEQESLVPGDTAMIVAEKMLAYFKERHPGVGVGFHIAGYRAIEGKASEPYVFVGHTTNEQRLSRANAGEDGVVRYGTSFAGDATVANRLIDQTHLPRFDAMPLQDAVDYAVHLIRTTIETLRFEPRYPSVGGQIDVLVVKPDGMQWVQRKHLRGEG